MATILIADHDPAAIRALVHEFRRHGHQVATATTSSAAMAQMACVHADVAVIDVDMEHLPGLLCEFWRRDPDLPNLAVVLTGAGGGDPELIERAMRCGGDYLGASAPPEVVRRHAEALLAGGGVSPVPATSQ
jgi:CheY-like chemotaxis protein